MKKLEIEYLESFDELRKISSKEFLKEKNKIKFFNTNEFSNDQAFMNFRMDGTIYEQFISMYEGYAETSLFLLEDCIKNRISNKKDIWMFPIFFNTIHALELFLKATRYFLENNFENYTDITWEGHNILQLSTVVNKKIKESNEFSKFETDFKLIHTFIKTIADMFKIDTVDKYTFIAPRYPITKQGVPYKYVEQNEKIEDTEFYKDENFKIEMSNLRIWLLKVYQVCEDFNMYIQEYFENLSNE